MAKRFPLHPPHPERNCWGCDRYCARDQLLCGNGSERTPHPVEWFGPDWADWVPPEPPALGEAGEPPSDATGADTT